MNNLQTCQCRIGTSTLLLASCRPTVYFAYSYMDKYIQNVKHHGMQTCSILKNAQKLRLQHFYKSDKSATCAHNKNAKNEFQYYIKKKRDSLKATEQKIKNCSAIISKEIEETKNRVKEKVVDVIEKENIYTIPNVLCVSRILLSPYLGVLIIQANFKIALVILGVAAVTDLLDGWIARTWASQSSVMGSFLDPMADKVLIATLFLSLTYAELIPLILTGLIVTRDVILVAAALIIRYKTLPPPRTLNRYFDISYATVQMQPTFISKMNTGVQLLLVGSTLAAPVFHYVGHPILQSLWYITAATTVAGGISYLLSRNTYRILKNKKNKQ